MSDRLRRWRTSRGRNRYDVVFYAPTVGATLKGGQFFPQGGAEKQVVMLARALSRIGYRVAVVVAGRHEELPAEIDGVTISTRTPATRGRGLPGRILEVFRISRSLAKVPSGFIIVRGATVDLGIIGLHARLARRRLVFSSANVSDFEPSRLESNRLYVSLYRLGVRLCSLVVVQTDEQASMCTRTFRCKPCVIRSISQPAPARAAVPEAFLWVGRLVTYKCPLEYILLARAVPEARFWMVGVPSPHLPEDPMLIDTVVKQAEQVPNLELLSPRPQIELQELMTRAVASVNTADFEGMSNVLLEGWSLGVPALVLNHDPDGLVSRHRLGAFAAGDSEEFINSARKLWQARKDRLDVSQRCRTYVALHHAPENIASEWAALLDGRERHRRS